MIFVTVGGQMPFDRLVRAVDEWAAGRADVEIEAQIGRTEYVPSNIPASEVLDPERFDEKMRRASLIVSHAGMGTILTALSIGKPIIVVPRRAALGEHRNDHQLATVRHLSESASIHVADDERALLSMLNSKDALPDPSRLSAAASPELLAFVRGFVGLDNDS